MFKRITASNFLSWGDLDINFDSGVTLIEGWNYDDETPEGSGKSAIPNALVWCIYGKLPKDSRVDDVIKQGEKSCVVEVELCNEFKIRRSRKPNKLQIFLPSVDDWVEGKDAKETQEIIEDRVGFTFDTFCQTIYFAQNYPKKFITANEEEKAKILSELQDLQVFDAARKVAHSKAKDLEVIIHRTQNELKLLETEATSEAESIQDLSDLKQENIEKFETQKQRVEEQLVKYQKELKTLKRTIGELKEPEVDEDGIRDELGFLLKEKTKIENALNNSDKQNRTRISLLRTIEKIETKQDKLVSEANGLKETPGSKCPTCGSSFSDKTKLENHLKQLESEWESLDKELKEAKLSLKDYPEVNDVSLENDLKEINTEEKKMKLELEKVKSFDREMKLYADDLKQCEYRIELTNKELDKLKAPDNTTIEKRIHVKTQKLLKLRKEIKLKISQISDLNLELNRYTTLKSSFKAVKSYVFQSVLHDLTIRSNIFLAHLFNQEVKIKFNNTGDGGEVSKIEVNVSIDGFDRPLGLYSGGQFRRIQLAVDLALSDILALRASKPVDWRCFDEYFKDLSEVSMTNILSLLEGLRGTTLLIEHNSLFKNIVNNSVKVELKNGTSTMVESNNGTETLVMQKMQTGN